MWDFLKHKYWGNSISAYLVALSILIVGFLIVFFLKKILFRYIKKFSVKTQSRIDDNAVSIIDRVSTPLLIYLSLYIACSTLTIQSALQKYIDYTGIIILTITGIRIFLAIGNTLLLHYVNRQGSDTHHGKSFKGILFIIRFLIWSAAFIFLLDNFGFKISSIIAGLGVGGIAVALAAQAILGDLFSYIAIILDKPFELGDFVIVGEYLGTVEHIGLKTTRIKSLSGEMLVFPNTDLSASRIKNFRQMDERRVIFTIGITYQASKEKVQVLPNIIKAIIEAQENTRFDRAHFKAFGDFSLNFEVVYYLLSNDYNIYMDCQQRINLALMEAIEKEGLEFAYPTHTIFLSKENSPTQ